MKYDGRHKARHVADGHLTPDPVESSNSGVVSLRNLRLVIFLGKLNHLELWGPEIGNVHTFSKALYGLKSSGKRWAEAVYDTLKDMDFIPS